MKCPACSVTVHPEWYEASLARNGYVTQWRYRTCECPACEKFIIQWQKDLDAADFWRQLEPAGGSRGPVPTEVPPPIATDYVEACNVLPISAKASAALARRCLQHILVSNGYKGKDLAKQIDAFLAETDPAKIAPMAIRDEVDTIRNFGNFSAHPITDQTTLQIIDVEPHEAEHCLEIVEALFQFFYVQPAESAKRRASLNAKLGSAGKPPAKG